MVQYNNEISKRIKKRLIPKEIVIHFVNAFTALEITKDLTLFDIKQVIVSEKTERKYYRLRKGKYRAIFYFNNDDIYVIALDKREEVYKKWQ